MNDENNLRRVTYEERKVAFSERKRERFVELAEKRVTNAIRAISLVGNLANKNNYKYDEQDVKKILKALNNEVSEVGMRFQTGKSEEKEFKL